LHTVAALVRANGHFVGDCPVILSRALAYCQAEEWLEEWLAARQFLRRPTGYRCSRSCGVVRRPVAVSSRV